MPVCSQCGQANAATADFCENPNCGAYLGWGNTGVIRRQATTAQPDPRPPLPVPPVPPGPPVPLGGRPRRGDAVTPQQPVTTTPHQPAQQQRQGVQVRLEPVELGVEPGGVTQATVRVRNTGTQVERFQLLARGPAAAFATIEPATLSVYPNDEAQAVVRFAPARESRSLAGQAPFDVLAHSEIHPRLADAAQGVLTIGAFEALRASLEPEASRGRRPKPHQVVVVNEGNRRTSVQAAFGDQNGELSFDPPQAAATLEPGAGATLPVLIGGRRRWFGRVERHPFSATLTPAGTHPPIELTGVRQQVPLFPWWVPPAALVLVALLIALLALLPGHKVPGTTGLPRVAAEQLLLQEDFRPVVIPQPDGAVAEGLVIKSDPAGGQALAKGEPVQLFVSLGPCPGACPVEVPNVVGLPKDQATSYLSNAKFTSRIVELSNDKFPAGVVSATDPAPLVKRQPGSEVVVTVSTGLPPSASAAPSSSAAPGGGAGGGAVPPPAAAPVTVPALARKPAAEAADALIKLGLKPKSVPVHSNEAPANQVLSSTPPAGAQVAPGSEVTLNLAQPTAPIDLIAIAPQAAWSSGAGPLTFGREGDSSGFVLTKPGATLPDGSTATVLETHPQAVNRGFIMGEFQLPAPLIDGDHLRATVGLLQGASDTVTFVVVAGGKELPSTTAGADGKLRPLDVDLTPAKGATSIQIKVLAGANPAQDAAFWKDLRIEGVPGG